MKLTTTISATTEQPGAATTSVDRTFDLTATQARALGELMLQALVSLPKAESDYVLGAIDERRIAEGIALADSLYFWGEFLADALVLASDR